MKKRELALILEKWIIKQDQCDNNVEEGSNQSSRHDGDLMVNAIFGTTLFTANIATNSVVALKLVANCVSIKGSVISRICGLARVFGMAYDNGTIYVTSAHPENGGILSLNYQEMLSAKVVGKISLFDKSVEIISGKLGKERFTDVGDLRLKLRYDSVARLQSINDFLMECVTDRACLRDRLKYSTSCLFNYFTSERHYYSKPDSNLIPVQLPKLRKPPRSTTVTKSQLDEMRIWRAEHGQSVRQLTVRNLSTKDKPCTLPLNCYTSRPDAPQPLDFSNFLVAEYEKQGRHFNQGLVIAVTIFCQNPFIPLHFYPVERTNLELEKIIVFLEVGNFKICEEEIVLSEGCHECMLVVCLDLGDTLTLAEQTEELDAAGCPTEDNMTADERSATARALRRERRKRKDQSTYNGLFHRTIIKYMPM
eukprot:gene13719-15149_t